MKTLRFGQHSPRFARGLRPARATRAARSKRIKSHDGIPEMSLRSWLWIRFATASMRWSQSGMEEIARPGE
jgi:hypothetical protein